MNVSRSRASSSRSSASAAGLDRVVAEAGGRLEIPVGGAGFLLTGRADRIELRSDGRLNILDYKTGTAPSARQAASLSPQLPLEAAMARRGAFPGVPAADVEDLAYVELKGGAAGGEEKPVRLKDRSTMDLAEAAYDGLASLLLAFENPGPGLPVPRGAAVVGTLRRLRSSRPRAWTGARWGGGRMSAALPAQDPKAEATRRQSEASHPHVSAWVSANAGSGKTHVLARRVIRLLLAGTPPGRILCLTYTKAAAANMANRVLAILGHWVRLPDADLDAAIAETVGSTASDVALRAGPPPVRGRAGDAGRPQIQTIHAFCGGLLHRFPFEADVAAGCLSWTRSGGSTSWPASARAS